MTFTRRRWDAWCWAGVLALCLGGVADCVLSGRFTPRVLAYPVAVLWMLPLRYRIPAEGGEVPALRTLPRRERFFILWCVLSLTILLCGIPVLRATRQYWWAWALGAAAHVLVTLRLASRIDQARRLPPSARA